MTDTQNPSWQDVLDLVSQLDAGAYDTASVQFGGLSVQLSRNGALPEPQTAPTEAQAHSADPAPAPAPAAAAPAPSSVPAAAPAEAAHPAVANGTSAPAGTPVPSPMVGVFYRSPSPGAEPFVTEGEVVEADTTIGIVEVMKLMNPVTAGIAGRLASFVVADAGAVEFGQTLAYIDESGA
ncbi:acetyl-CoA carboxylase biotin carboxyl carrier protein [Sinomonas flava]|uniref:acetyl-CoA carboxylase biotin carboxyl carrier protein n=1 Tax=Sinomonas flava TaxID=496857 RepID=UPI0039A606C6